MVDAGADPDRAIRSIVVVGGGIVALTAALAFARALPRVTVTMIETPSDPAALADRLTTAWPSINRFHAAIGLTDNELLATGAATPLLGTRYDNSATGAPPFFLVHGQYGVPMGSVPFHEIWARAWASGTARPYSDYATAAVLAASGRFVLPESDSRSPLSTYDYGWRLDPERYRTLLATLADRAGVAHLSGAVAAVTRRADGGVATLQLADGREVLADLFLDCAGPTAPLATLLDMRFIDWSADLLADRVLLGEGAPSGSTSCDRVVGTPLGWRWDAHLPDRTMSGIAYSAGAEDRAATLLDRRDPEIVRLRPGWRDPWRNNVLAIGDAAIAAGPVPGIHLHMAHRSIALALDLLPGRDCHASETDEYRRRAARQAAHLRDFLALFEPQVEMTPTIEQFVRRGRFPSRDDDAVAPEIWISTLIGCGFVPCATSALAQVVDVATADALLADLAGGLATVPGQLPSYADYLATMAAS